MIALREKELIHIPEIAQTVKRGFAELTRFDGRGKVKKS